MAVTTAWTNQCKLDFINGVHLAAHVYKIAVIKTGHAGTYGKNTLAVGTPGSGAPTTSNLGTDECPASGDYPAGGVTLIGRTVALSGDTAYLDFAAMAQRAGVTMSGDGAIIYNDSVAGKPALYVTAFSGAPIVATAGTYDVAIPTSGLGIIEIT